MGGVSSFGPYGRGKAKSHSDASHSSVSRGRPSTMRRLIEAQRATTTAVERGQRAIAEAIMSEGAETRKCMEESRATTLKHDAEQRALDRNITKNNIRILVMAMMGKFHSSD